MRMIYTCQSVGDAVDDYNAQREKVASLLAFEKSDAGRKAAIEESQRLFKERTERAAVYARNKTGLDERTFRQLGYTLNSPEVIRFSEAYREGLKLNPDNSSQSKLSVEIAKQQELFKLAAPLIEQRAREKSASDRKAADAARRDDLLARVSAETRAKNERAKAERDAANIARAAANKAKYDAFYESRRPVIPPSVLPASQVATANITPEAAAQGTIAVPTVETIPASASAEPAKTNPLTLAAIGFGVLKLLALI